MRVCRHARQLLGWPTWERGFGLDDVWHYREIDMKFRNRERLAAYHAKRIAMENGHAA